METIQSRGKNSCINLKAVTTCCDDFAEGNIPIFIIHGFAFNKSSWLSQMEFLKQAHRVIVCNIGGFGKSTVTSEKFVIPLFVDDMVDIMDVMQAGKVISGGLSMGGYILLNAINRYPESFEAIILSDAKCMMDDSSVWKLKGYKAIDQVNCDEIKGFAASFVKNIFCPDSLDNKKKLVQRIRDIILSASPVAITQTLSVLAARLQMCWTLNQILIPAVILPGEGDTVTSITQAEYLHETYCKFAEFLLIKTAGHLSNLEQADEFNQYPSRFISNEI